MLNEGCLVSRNIYLLDCSVRTWESYVTNRASIPSLSVHISYAYELPCRSIIIPIVGHRKPKKCCRYFGSAHTLIARSLVWGHGGVVHLCFPVKATTALYRHPFLFNCKHHFPLVQPHYNNRKSPCQHPENSWKSRVLQFFRQLFPYSFFRSFECFLVVNILRKNFSKNFLITTNLAFSGVISPHVAIKKKKASVYSPEQTPALNHLDSF